MATTLNAIFYVLCCYTLQYFPPSGPFSQATFSKFCTHSQCPLARSLSCTSLEFGCNNICEGRKYNCESAQYADLFTVFGTDIFLSTTFPNNVTPTYRESVVGIVNRLRLDTCSIPDKCMRFFCSYLLDWLWGPSSLLLNYYRGLFLLGLKRPEA